MHNDTCSLDECRLPRMPKRRTGSEPLYCSIEHRRRAAYLRGRDEILARRAEESKRARQSSSVRCAHCGSDFTPENSLKQRFCSRRCCAAAYSDSHHRMCSEDDCSRAVRARGLCAMHWKRARAAEIGHKPQPFDGARMRRYYERKNWLRDGDDVTVAGLRERDGDDCGLCGVAIDFSLDGRNPMGRTVDHVLPRARGGVHTWANTQLAHLRCNLQKGARVA